MSSAMSAVAVRHGRKKPKMFARFGGKPPSHHSSLVSLSRNRSFLKRQAHQRISTISSQGPIRRYTSDVDRQRRRFLIYLGTIFLITGLLLVFIGVGAGVGSAQTVGLLLIGIGAVLCIIKVFYSEAQATKVVQKLTVNEAESEAESAENLATPEVTPVVEEFTALPEQPDAQQNNSLSPASLNSIPETQVLITQESERY